MLHPRLVAASSCYWVLSEEDKIASMNVIESFLALFPGIKSSISQLVVRAQISLKGKASSISGRLKMLLGFE